MTNTELELLIRALTDFQVIHQDNSHAMVAIHTPAGSKFTFRVELDKLKQTRLKPTIKLFEEYLDLQLKLRCGDSENM